MSEQTLIPVLRVLDADPVGFCEPGSDYCEVPDIQAARPTTATAIARLCDRTLPTRNLVP
jgi:hypothetical protein